MLVPLNTRFKGGEAAYIIRDAGATTLVTVRGFLGVDYPALLAGEDTGDLARIVLLRDEGDGGGRGRRGAVPVTGLDAFLAGRRAASIRPTSAARAAAVEPDDVSDLIFTSGTTGHPKGAATTHAQSSADLRDVVVHRRAGRRRPLPRRQPVLPHLRLQGGHPGLPDGRGHRGARAGLRRGRGHGAHPAERISVLPGPPTLYQTLLADPRRAEHDLSSLRLGVTGAAVVPVELVQAMRDELGFDTVLTAYGLTESCGTVTMCRRSDPPEVVAGDVGPGHPGPGGRRGGRRVERRRRASRARSWCGATP